VKINIRATVKVDVEKTVEAESIEAALAQARKMEFKDFLWVGSKTLYFTDSVKVDIKSITRRGAR